MKTLIVFLLAVLIGYILVSSTIQNRFKEIELNARVLIAEQEALLSVIAETTARNGADAVTEAIIRDCPIDQRSSFDNLLSRIDSLNYTQLTELERLFGRCGSFTASRKAVMVSRLTREIEVYESYVGQLSKILDADQSAAFAVAKWRALITEEQNQSEGFAKLVELQDDIISELLAGKTAASPDVQEILQEASAAREKLLVDKKQADAIRSELVSL
ncbi:hypothetical protein KC906_02720 [Candidatus Kaiserbacteria bacterium]|nr:hypothetical protein [Candidatus Kaiserbacteria bacterium]